MCTFTFIFAGNETCNPDVHFQLEDDDDEDDDDDDEDEAASPKTLPESTPQPLDSQPSQNELQHSVEPSESIALKPVHVEERTQPNPEQNNGVISQKFTLKLPNSMEMKQPKTPLQSSPSKVQVVAGVSSEPITLESRNFKERNQSSLKQASSSLIPSGFTLKPTNCEDTDPPKTLSESQKQSSSATVSSKICIFEAINQLMSQPKVHQRQSVTATSPESFTLKVPNFEATTPSKSQPKGYHKQPLPSDDVTPNSVTSEPLDFTGSVPKDKHSTYFQVDSSKLCENSSRSSDCSTMSHKDSSSSDEESEMNEPANTPRSPQCPFSDVLTSVPLQSERHSSGARPKQPTSNGCPKVNGNHNMNKQTFSMPFANIQPSFFNNTETSLRDAGTQTDKSHTVHCVNSFSQTDQAMYGNGSPQLLNGWH